MERIYFTPPCQHILYVNFIINESSFIGKKLIFPTFLKHKSLLFIQYIYTIMTLIHHL